MDFNFSKTPYLFVDLMSIAAGILFLLFLNLHLNYNLQNFPNFSLIYENQPALLLIFVSVAYFIGNILFAIAYFLMKIFFAVPIIFNKKTNENKMDNILGISRENALCKESVLLYLEENETLKDEFYRINYSLFFTNFVLGGALILFLITWIYYFGIATLILIAVNIIQTDYRNRRERKMLEEINKLKS